VGHFRKLKGQLRHFNPDLVAHLNGSSSILLKFHIWLLIRKIKKTKN
jgi:hypothetical protein